MDNLEKLQQLKQLLDEGILSQEEFEKRKEKILFPEKAEEEKRKLEEESQRQEEENRKNEIFEGALKKFEEKTSEAYKAAIAELEELGEWKDANNIAEKYKEELPEIEAAEAEQKAEEEREALYDKAIKKFDIRTSKSFKSAIADLESLGEWKDSAAIVEEKRPELQEIEEEEKKKKAALKKKLIIAAIAVVVVIVAYVVIKAITTPNLAKYSATKDAKVNSMDYKIPEECVVEDAKHDTFVQYSISKGNKVVGVVEVEYRGDSDLEGTAGYDAETAEHKTTDSALALIPNASGTFETIEADNSIFEVTVYCDEEKVKGGSELLDAITESFNVSGYSNPRTSKGIKANYTGDTSSGVTIKEGVEGLSVSEEFATAIGSGTKEVSYKIEKPVKLEAGETSTVEIKANGDTCKLKIKCSDHGAFYKDGSFNASMDDIMADYKDKYSHVRAYSGSTLTGGNINIVQKGDTYGGQFNCTATDHSFIVTFNTVNSAGDDFVPTDEVPDRILILVKTDGDEESKDLMCIVALFGNMLCNLNPDISESEAYNAVLSAMQSAEGDTVASSNSSCKGVPFAVFYSPGLYSMGIDR